MLNKMKNGKLKDNKEDKDISTTGWKYYDLETYNEKHKNIWWKTRMLCGMNSHRE